MQLLLEGCLMPVTIHYEVACTLSARVPREYKLYLFIAGSKSIGLGNSVPTDASGIDQDFQYCKSMTYIYDMGADWTHKIKIENLL